MAISSGSGGAGTKGARRLRRLTFLPWSIPQGLRELWFDLFRERVASGVQLVGLCNSLAVFVDAVGAQATPTSRPRLVFVAEVRHCASCPFGRRLSSPCLVHDHVVESAVEDGAGKRGADLRLEAAKDGHVAVLQEQRGVCHEGKSPAVRPSWPH